MEKVTQGANGLTTREVTFESGQVQRTTQAANGAVTQEIKFPDGSTRTTVQTRLVDGASASMTTRVGPDGQPQVSITLDRTGGRPSTVITRNADGTFSFTTQSPQGATMANPAATNYTFDRAGVVTRTNPDGSTTTINTRTGAIVQQVSENQTATRNADGSVTVRTRDGNVITQETRDEMGRMMTMSGATVDSQGNVSVRTQVPDPLDPTKSLTQVRTIQTDGSIQTVLEGRPQSGMRLNPDGSLTLGPPPDTNSFLGRATGFLGSVGLATSVTVPPTGLPLNAEVNVLGQTRLFSDVINQGIAQGNAPNPFAGMNSNTVNSLNSLAGVLDQTGININSQFPANLAFGVTAFGTRQALSVPQVRADVMAQFNNMHFGGRLGIINNIVHNAGNNNPQRVFSRVTTGQLQQGIFQQAAAGLQTSGIPVGPMQRPATVTPISGQQFQTIINSTSALSNLGNAGNSPFNLQIQQITPTDLRSIANGQIPTSPDIRLIPRF